MNASVVMIRALFSISFLLLAAVGSTEVQTISAVIGGEVTLPCRAEGYMPLEVMEWSRPGTHLQYVVFFRTPGQDLEIPEQRYKGRVELVDLKNGDVSLLLKNVTAEDGGTYECYVMKDTDQGKRDRLISTIYLDVIPPPGNKDKEGKPSNIRSSFVAAVAINPVLTIILVPLMVFAVIKWKKKNYRPSPQDKAETAQIA